MEAELFEKLMAFIKEHNPELILNAAQNFSLTQYVSDKVANASELIAKLQKAGTAPYIIQDRCMEALTKDLLPSKADYIRATLEDEFPEEFERFTNAGVLTYEVVNLIEYCAEVFEAYEFNAKNKGSRFLRYAIIAQVADYLIDRS